MCVFVGGKALFFMCSHVCVHVWVLLIKYIYLCMVRALLYCIVSHVAKLTTMPYSCLQVHSLFSLLGLNHAYVTNTGRLVGVVGLKEVSRITPVACSYLTPIVSGPRPLYQG